MKAHNENCKFDNISQIRYLFITVICDLIIRHKVLLASDLARWELWKINMLGHRLLDHVQRGQFTVLLISNLIEFDDKHKLQLETIEIEWTSILQALINLTASLELESTMTIDKDVCLSNYIMWLSWETLSILTFAELINLDKNT